MRQDLRKQMAVLKDSLANAASEKATSGGTSPTAFLPLAETVIAEAVALGQKFAEEAQLAKVAEANALAEVKYQEQKAAQAQRKAEVEAQKAAEALAQAASVTQPKVVVPEVVEEATEEVASVEV